MRLFCIAQHTSVRTMAQARFRLAALLLACEISLVACAYTTWMPLIEGSDCYASCLEKGLFFAPVVAGGTTVARNGQGRVVCAVTTGMMTPVVGWSGFLKGCCNRA